MAAIAAAPFVLKDVTFQVGTDSYEQHVSSVRFDPQISTVSWKGLSPAANFTDTTAPTWQCTITFAQDWTTANSLSQYLMTNAGTQKVVVFKPVGTTTGKPIFTVTLNIAPGSIGGDVDTYATATVTMGCVSAPVKSAAP